MDSKIIDHSSLFVNAEECQRLSYEMLFNNGNGHSKAESKNGNGTADARKIQKKHQQELRQLGKEWQEKLETAKEEAYREGLEEGKAIGKEEAEESIDQKISAVKDAVVSVNDQMNDLLDDLKPQVATMVFDVAEKVIGLPVKSETLKENVADEIRQILASIKKELQVNVEVAATEYGFIVRALKDLPDFDHIEINSSDELNPGEYSVDTHNERIVKSFKKILRDFREKVALEDEAELEVQE